jgi:hypothetical protein
MVVALGLGNRRWRARRDRRPQTQDDPARLPLSAIQVRPLSIMRGLMNQVADGHVIVRGRIILDPPDSYDSDA